ncbi:hypothetical protein CsSME_00037166 [Camellia sinensis var. sinensis]
MASSPSPSPSPSCSSKPILILIVILILMGSSGATRPGAMKPEHFKPHRRQMGAGNGHESMVFNTFPKGTPIPPSAPSKRHNFVVSSSPHN